MLLLCVVSFLLFANACCLLNGVCVSCVVRRCSLLLFASWLLMFVACCGLSVACCLLIVVCCCFACSTRVVVCCW